MIYNIETLSQSELLRLIMDIHDHYQIDAIDYERIREELDKTETLVRKKQIAKDIANSGYSQEEVLNVLSNISDHRTEVDDMSNATTEPHEKTKSASVQGLIDATNSLINESAANFYNKKVVMKLKATVAHIIIDNVNNATISLYVDSKGNYKTEEAFRLVFRKAHNSDFCKLLANLKNESHIVNTLPKVNESEIEDTVYLQNRQNLNSNIEVKRIRLNKVATELNVGIQTIVQFLYKKGHGIEANPNTKITNQQYNLLLSAFGNERNVKEKSNKKESLRTGGNRVILATKNIDNKYDANNKKEQVEDNGDNNPKPMSKNARKKERRRAERRAMMATKVISE